MTTFAPSAVAGLVSTAAVKAAAVLASAEALTPGEPTTDAPAASGKAVVAAFTGSHAGELVLVVDAELSAALENSALGPLDLAAALGPAVEQIAAAVGRVALGKIEAMDARLALHRLGSHAESAVVALSGSTGPRAWLAVAIDASPAAAASVATPVLTDLAAARLDLLRGVEMAATAELGRARMTVNDLLSLRTGAVIELDRAAGAAADLYVNGRLIARGEVVVIDENYGLRITQVVTDENAGR